MNLNQVDARQSLDEIDLVKNRIRSHLIYKNAPPYFFIWGAFYLVLNLLIHFKGYLTLPIFLAMQGIAVGACIVVSRFQRKATQGSNYHGSKSEKINAIKGWATIVLLISFVFVINFFGKSLDGRSMTAIITLYGAIIYAAVGIWWGVRWIVVAASLTAVTLFCYFFIQQDFFLWTGVAGGLTVMVSGLLMAKV